MDIDEKTLDGQVMDIRFVDTYLATLMSKLALLCHGLWISDLWTVSCYLMTKLAFCVGFSLRWDSFTHDFMEKFSIKIEWCW